MDVSQNAVRLFVIGAGALVLASYAWGVSRAPRPADLWGGVGPAQQAATVPVMLLAAAGFATYAWILLFAWSPTELGQLRWPGGTSDGQGTTRLLVAMVLFLIPSVFWIEATLLHLRSPAWWTPVLTIGILFLVAVGNALLIALAATATADGHPNSRWLLAGSIALGLQCIINDLVIWSAMFDWRAA